jgi:hypothetical protein
MSTISSISNSNVYNPQIVNKVAEASSTNLANLAANQSAFSSYIGQAFAQIGIANPTNLNAPVVSGSNQTATKGDDTQETVSTFIQNLFDVLSQKNTEQKPNESVELQRNFEQLFELDNNTVVADENTNSEAIAAYTSENATTVGNIVTNLQALVEKLNDTARKAGTENSGVLDTLQSGFQRILQAHGANANDTTTLGSFLQTLAQNLEGQSPLGIIFNTYS